LLLAVAFNAFDLYDRFFYVASRFDNLSYSAARIVFVFFLFEITFALGQAPLSAIRKRGIEFALNPAEELAISLICGSAILRAAMLILGFADLYYWWIMAIGGAITVAFGWTRFELLVRDFTVTWYRGIRDSNPFERLATAGLLVALLFAVGQVVTEKLLLPNGTGDFYTHYLPYTQHVVASHNIWPNEVWYHFYSSKALGESFFAVLVIGPLGNQAASCAMFFATLLVMFCFVERATEDRLVALAAVTATATGLVWTIGLSEWAEFSKEHVITAALLFGCIWATWRSRTILAAQQWAWAALTSLAYCGLILLRVQLALVVMAVLFALAAWDLLSRKRERLIGVGLQIGAVMLTATAVLILNYAATGLAEVTPFRVFWAFADQAKFAHWVSPFVMLMLQLGSSPQVGAVAPPSLQQFPTQILIEILHFDRAAPFMGPWGATFLIVLAIGLFRLRDATPTQRATILSTFTILSLMLGAAAVGALFTIDQYVSIYRLYMFCMLPVIALAALPFALARRTLRGIGSSAIGIVLALQLLIAVAHDIGSLLSG
jgi:hypothetical protein